MLCPFPAQDAIEEVKLSDQKLMPEVRATLIDQLRRRFPTNLEEPVLMAMASLIDPRVFDFSFTSNKNVSPRLQELAIAGLRRAFEDELKSAPVASSSPSSSASSSSSSSGDSKAAAPPLAPAGQACPAFSATDAPLFL